MKRLPTRSFPKLQKAKGEPLWLILLGNYKALIAALWVVAVIIWGVSELLPRKSERGQAELLSETD